ncbi:hypothetical protein Sjap_002480 [Stephania japonica]|uniref:Protein kinase domain-containing protein n=1 Tax=Stephania japonica TaxID=461633 RepID=A0AAP0KMV9_9MAGN
MGARGTIGYIAPELVLRTFGKVSHKSDVYSYGMMVLEMVGQRRNVDAGADNTSEIYFPHWIYKRLEQLPSMNKVLDMLEGRIEDLEIPPMPFLHQFPHLTKKLVNIIVMFIYE